MTSTARGALVAALAAAALVTAPAAAGAAAVPGAQPGDTSYLSLAWDGGEPVTTTTSFLGAPVVVPGASAARTLVVRNDGPTAGTLRASIVDARVLDPGALDAGAGADGRRFYDDLTVSWQTEHTGGVATFTELDAAGSTAIGEVPLARGASTRITVAYEFPAQATSGNRANVDPREASLDVRLVIGEDVPPGSEPRPTPGGAEPSPGATDPPPGRPADAADPSAERPDAGGPGGTATATLPASGAPVHLAAVVALTVLHAGLLVLVAAAQARRRAAMVCPADGHTPGGHRPRRRR